jgi:hypothetical protein
VKERERGRKREKIEKERKERKRESELNDSTVVKNQVKTSGYF